METDSGRAVMKTYATKAKDLFKVVKPTPVATTLFSGLSTITWQRSTRSDLHDLDAAPRIVLISIHVVRTLSQPHIKSAWPSPDPDSNSGLQVLTEVEG